MHRLATSIVRTVRRAMTSSALLRTGARLAASRRGSVRPGLAIVTAVCALTFAGCCVVLAMEFRPEIVGVIGQIAKVVQARVGWLIDPNPAPSSPPAAPMPAPTKKGPSPYQITVTQPSAPSAPPPVNLPSVNPSPAGPPLAVGQTAQAPMPAVQRPGGPPPKPMPSVVTPRGTVGGTTVEARRAANGHFFVDADVNGTTVHMIVDTGASTVSLRAEDAERMGIDLRNLVYSEKSNTANGVATFAPYVIETMKVGDISVNRVRAHIARRGALSVSLLGQSFMERLARFDVEGNVMKFQGR